MKQEIIFKPKPNQFYDWIDVKKYLKNKYGDKLDFDQYIRDTNSNYSNGSLVTVYLDYYDDKEASEINKIITEEFGEEVKIHYWW